MLKNILLSDLNISIIFENINMINFLLIKFFIVEI